MTFAVQIFAVLLFASAASAQLNCPVFNGATTSYVWNPDFAPFLTLQTVKPGMRTYDPSMNCYFSISSTIPGRIVVKVISSDLLSYNAYISIRTDALSGYLADWSHYTYNADRNRDFVSITNRLYIVFTTDNKQWGSNTGVQLQLTFLRSGACLPAWPSISLANSLYCIGRPINTAFKFGDAQRYCNLWRSNLLVTDRDNVSMALGSVNAYNAWIGMTAEPSGTYSYYRWINNAPVDRRLPVACDGDCKPGSTKHRCVQARTPQSLAQVNCDTPLPPICYMPAGGTDVFFKSSQALKVSGALLSGAMLLILSLVH